MYMSPLTNINEKPDVRSYEEWLEMPNVSATEDWIGFSYTDEDGSLCKGSELIPVKIVDGEWVPN